MHSHLRPNKHDWLVGILVAAGLGLILLGVGGRMGMRAIALATGQTPLFTPEGSIAVSLLGAAAGAVVGATFLLARTLFPARRWARTGFFWSVCGIIVLRGLNPVSTLNAAIFLPLFVVHGALLYRFWCRVYLPRQQHAGSPA